MSHTSLPGSLRPRILIVCVTALLGGALTLASTPHGIGLSPDSTAYVAGARNLLAGHGFVRMSARDEPVPITLYPPLYSVALAFPGLFGVDALDAARLVNALLFAATGALIGLALLAGRPDRLALAIAGEALFLISPDMLTLHAMAWSEPLFLTLTIIVLLALEEPRTTAGLGRWILLSILVAIALLARYAALALLATAAIRLLLAAGRPPAQRVRRALLLLAIAGPPLALWWLRNLRLTGNAVSRPISWHPVGLDDARVGLRTLSSWFLPEWGGAVASGGLVLALCVLAGAAAIAGARARDQGDGPAPSPAAPAAPAIFFFVYALFVIASSTFIESDLPMDARILAPLYPCALLTLLPWLSRAACWVSERARGAARVAIPLALAALVAPRGVDWVARASADGMGYAAASWKASAVIAATKGLPQGARIYTNAPDALYILTGKRTSRLPRAVDQHSRIPNARYGAELALIAEDLVEHEGVIVLLDRVAWRWYLPSEEDLVNALPLVPVARVADGVIYAGAGSTWWKKEDAS